MDEFLVAYLPYFLNWKDVCVGNLFEHPGDNEPYKNIEGVALLQFREVERCLYDLYAYDYFIRDIPLLTRKMNYIFLDKFDFSEDAINRGLYNVRKMVSLKYLEEKRTALVKAAKRLPLLDGELLWEDWATLSAIEEAKIIKARSTVINEVLLDDLDDDGYVSGFSDSESSSYGWGSEEDSDWEPEPKFKPIKRNDTYTIREICRTEIGET